MQTKAICVDYCSMVSRFWAFRKVYARCTMHKKSFRFRLKLCRFPSWILCLFRKDKDKEEERRRKRKKMHFNERLFELWLNEWWISINGFKLVCSTWSLCSLFLLFLSSSIQCRLLTTSIRMPFLDRFKFYV